MKAFVLFKWLLRILTAAPAALIAFILFAHCLHGELPPLKLYVIVTMFCWLLCIVGSVVLFFLQGIGGMMIVAGLLIFMIQEGKFLHEPILALWFGLGVLNVVCWWIDRRFLKTGSES